MTRIYYLVDPRTDRPFYVGATKDCDKNLRRRHERLSVEETRGEGSMIHPLYFQKTSLIKLLINSGLSFRIQTVCETPAQHAREAERIAYYEALQKGYTLLQDKNKFSYGTNIKKES